MGNLTSTLNENLNLNLKEPVKKEENSINEEEIFSKIWEISNNLLMEYNNEFLKEDFCNKIAIIYEKKLSKINIKLLKSLYNNINSENVDNVDNEMLMTLQYIPKNDDEFYTEIFKDNLNEKFWKEKIEINIKDIEIDNITSSIKYIPYYINPVHVNNLLQSINKINAELKPNNIEPIKGGFNESRVKIVNNQETNKAKKFLNNMGIENNENHIKNKLVSNKKLNNNLNNNLNNYFNSNLNNEENLFNNKKTKENNLNKNNNLNNEENLFNNKNLEENILKQNNKNKNLEQKPLLNIQNNKNKEPKNNTIQKLNEVTNNLIAKNINIPSNENIDDKIINEHIKYFVPKNYQKPTSFCDNVEKCKLSKKDICSAITENFIVRNNIIAAILTTVPYKNSEGLYEGGICFQKFMNLNNCNVCVPYDYRELKNRDIKSILTKILEKADNLDENRCRENQGYFLKLNDNEKKILASKISNISEKDIDNYPKIKYNYYFIQFTKRLQNNYLQNLNSLITILEKIKELPVINNTTLNLISDETKKIIDNMYNTCHYYYVYAIISLISADITEEVIKKDDLGNIISDVLKK